MTTVSRIQATIAVVWSLVVGLITVAIYEHGQAIAARAIVSESLILMDRALLEIQRSDSVVVRTLRLGAQAYPGRCELLVASSYGALTSIKDGSWKSIDLTSTP
jgi:hypothetical protein